MVTALGRGQPGPQVAVAFPDNTINLNEKDYEMQQRHLTLAENRMAEALIKAVDSRSGYLDINCGSPALARKLREQFYTFKKAADRGQLLVSPAVLSALSVCSFSLRGQSDSRGGRGGASEGVPGELRIQVRQGAASNLGALEKALGKEPEGFSTQPARETHSETVREQGVYPAETFTKPEDLLKGIAEALQKGTAVDVNKELGATPANRPSNPFYTRED